MAGLTHAPEQGGDLPPIAAADTARYTRDMLETLKRIAVRQDQIVLARLLEAAGREAERLVRDAG